MTFRYPLQKAELLFLSCFLWSTFLSHLVVIISTWQQPRLPEVDDVTYFFATSSNFFVNGLSNQTSCTMEKRKEKTLHLYAKYFHCCNWRTKCHAVLGRSEGWHPVSGKDLFHAINMFDPCFWEQMVFIVIHYVFLLFSSKVNVNEPHAIGT